VPWSPLTTISFRKDRVRGKDRMRGKDSMRGKDRMRGDL